MQNQTSQKKQTIIVLQTLSHTLPGNYPAPEVVEKLSHHKVKDEELRGILKVK